VSYTLRWGSDFHGWWATQPVPAANEWPYCPPVLGKWNGVDRSWGVNAPCVPATHANTEQGNAFSTDQRFFFSKSLISAATEFVKRPHTFRKVYRHHVQISWVLLQWLYCYFHLLSIQMPGYHLKLGHLHILPSTLFSVHDPFYHSRLNEIRGTVGVVN
jgi:hypothetical protein